uniref:TPR_REGION domain-containing protein n=1 Tax=Parastrongyloides trichosuri TaxID=131310 RepID=A0A0N4ZC40_PARTI
MEIEGLKKATEKNERLMSELKWIKGDITHKISNDIKNSKRDVDSIEVKFKMFSRKKILRVGKGETIGKTNGTKVYFHYETYLPDKAYSGDDFPSDPSFYTCIDSTKRSWPKGFGREMEIVMGKKFQLEFFEYCLSTMKSGEVAFFDAAPNIIPNYGNVSARLRDMVKPTGNDRGGSDSHNNSHGGVCCGASVNKGTGYDELDKWNENPISLRFKFEITKIMAPGSYTQDDWQLDDTAKLSRAESLRLEGNGLVTQKDYEGAIEKYGRALTLIDQVLLKESPNTPEFNNIDMLNVPLYSNLSLCFLKLTKIRDCIKTATEALNRDPRCEKALYRRAEGYIHEWQFREAMDDLEALKNISPENLQLYKQGVAKVNEVKIKHQQTQARYAKKMFPNA